MSFPLLQVQRWLWVSKHYVSKVGGRSRGRPEGSLFNSHYTEVLERALYLYLDYSTLPLIRTLYCWVLSKEISSTIFKVLGMTRPGIEPRCPWPLVNTLPTWSMTQLQTLCHHYHHHVVLLAWISLVLSRNFFLSFIASGRSSGQHPVSSHSCWVYVRAGRPAFARPYVGFHRSISLVAASPAVSCMSGWSNLDSFRDGRQVAV